MSLELTQFPNLPWQGGQAQGVNVALCTPLNDTPRIVPIKIDWSQYATTQVNLGVSINLLTGTTAALKQIRGIYIDNSLSENVIYAFFPDTGYTVFAPPGTIVMMPVVTNLQNAIIYALNLDLNDLPETTVFFSNIQFDPIVLENPSASTSDVLPILTFDGTTSSTLSTGQTVKQFTNVPLGAIDADRLSVFVVCWTGNAPDDVDLLNCVVNGVNIGAPFVSVASDSSAGVSGSGCAIFFTRVNPAIVTANIQLTFDKNANTATIFSYDIVGVNDDIPLDYSFAKAPAGTNAAQTVTVGVPQYGVSIYGAASTSTAATPTMTNSFIDAIQTHGVGQVYGCSHYRSPIDQNRTVGNTGASLLGAAWF